MDFSKKNGKWTWKNLPYATIIEKYIWPGIKAVGRLILYGIAAIIHFIIWASLVAITSPRSKPRSC